MNRIKEVEHPKSASFKEPTQKIIPNYSTVAKTNQREALGKEVRLRFNFENSNGPATTFKTVLQNLLNIANSFEKEAMIMTWEDKTEKAPKTNLDLQTDIVHDKEFMRYLDVPDKHKTQGFTTRGVIYYYIGIRFSTNLDLEVFKEDSWDLKKKEIISK